MDAARAALEKEPHVSHDDFNVYIGTPPDSSKDKGQQVDNVVAQARGAAPRDFCRRHGQGYTFRCSIDKFTLHDAGVICRSWCHRFQYVYDLERTEPEGQAIVFSARHVDAYEEPPELLILMGRPGLSDKVVVRVAQMRNTFSPA